MKRFMALIAIAAVSALTLGVSASSADVERYQVCTATYHAVLTSGGTFDWTLTIEFVHPGTTFSGTADLGSTHGTVEGTFAENGTMTFVVTYLYEGVTYEWHVTATTTDHFATGTSTSSYLTWSGGRQDFANASTAITRTSATCSNYKNHGEYVSSQGDSPRDDAAHAMVGMPVK